MWSNKPERVDLTITIISTCMQSFSWQKLDRITSACMSTWTLTGELMMEKFGNKSEMSGLSESDEINLPSGTELSGY